MYLHCSLHVGLERAIKLSRCCLRGICCYLCFRVIKRAVYFFMGSLLGSQLALAGAFDDRANSVVARLEAASLFMCEISSPSGDVTACGGEVSIIESGSYNAWSRGGRIFLTRRLVDHSTDDELAYVIAHEMAHVILEHPKSSNKNELEADYWSARLMNRANFDVNAAKKVLSRGQFRRILGFPFSLFSHPSNSRRLRTIGIALEEDKAFNTIFTGERDEDGTTGLFSRLP